MSRERPSRVVVFASSISSPLTHQLGDEIRAQETSLQRSPTARRAHGDVIVVEPEGDFVTWMDSQLVAQVLRDDNLPLRPNSMSHTIKYNFTAST